MSELYGLGQEESTMRGGSVSGVAGEIGLNPHAQPRANGSNPDYAPIEAKPEALPF